MSYCAKCGKQVTGVYCSQCGNATTMPFYRKIPGFRSGKKWKSIIAIIGYAFIGLFILGLIVPKPSAPPTPAAPVATVVPAKPVDQPIPAGIAEKMSVKVEVQDMLDSKNNNKVVCTLKNNSDLVVSGKVSFKLKDAAGNTVSSDTMYFENVKPGLATFSISWLKAFRTTKYEWEVLVTSAKPQ